MIRSLFRWWWVAVALLFTLCVAFKLNGSSIGRWQYVLQESAPIRGLLLSTPKKIRSDEWVVWTPSILSQARQTPAFPIENPSLGYGRAPLLMSVPVAYYTTLFRPQLWGFFLFDFERGFSFYWCSKIFGVLLAVGWLLRQLGVRNRGIVFFGAVWVFFSSFVQWWFSSPAMLPEMVASWAICIGCVIAFCQGRASRWSLMLAWAGFVFFGINFVLCLYPPFQIPLLLLGLAVLAGFWMENRKREPFSRTGRGLLFFALAGSVILLALVPFWNEARTTLEVVAQTEYPGRRRRSGGNYSVFQLFMGPIGFFESEDRIPPGFRNICEASNFYPLWPLVLLGMAAAKARSRAAISPLFVMLTVVIVSLSLYCVVPLPAWLSRATLLAYSQEARALLGIGLANILLVCLFLDRYPKPIFGRAWAVSGGLASAFAIGLLFYAIHVHDPKFLLDRVYLTLLISVNVIIVTLFFWDGVRGWLPAVFALLLICSNGLINPIMRGLGPLTESAAFQEVDKVRVGDPGAKWIAYGDYLSGQLVTATGAPVLNGTKIVPDLAFMRQLDAKRTNEAVYNRYAWIVCTLQVFPDAVAFSLLKPDFYMIKLPPGLPILREAGYHYYVFPTKWHDASFYDFAPVANTPSESLWIYQRSNTAKPRPADAATVTP